MPAPSWDRGTGSKSPASSTAFTNQVKTLDGNTIDMETYGLANGIGWHAFWFVLGAAWLLWWVRRPLFPPRYGMLQSGQGKWLITFARSKSPWASCSVCRCSFLAPMR